MVALLDVRKAPYVPRGSARALWQCKDREVLHDGPVRTGKTRGALEKVLLGAMKYPRSRQMLLRRHFIDLAETVLQTFEDHVLPPEWVPRGSRMNRHKYELPNGSVIIPMGLDRPTAAMGGEYDRILMDETIEIPRETAEYLSTRLTNAARSDDGVVMYPQMMYLTNPGPPTHWLWQRHTKEGLRRIPSTHRDNPRWWDQERGCWTDEGAELMRGLEALTGALKARLKDGKWVGAEGLIFDAFSEDLHVLRADGKPNAAGLSLPPDFADLWRVRAIDFGFKEPFVCGWFAVDGDGRMYLEREYVKAEVPITAHAKRVKRLTPIRQHVQFTVADHDAGDRAVLREHGIETVRAIKPKAGETWISHFEPIWQRLAKAGDGKPRFFVVDNSVQMGGGVDANLKGKPCGFREEVASYAWLEPANGGPFKERPAQKDDHACDMTRYAVWAVDKWFDGSLRREAEPYPAGTLGDMLGLDPDDPV